MSVEHNKLNEFSFVCHPNVHRLCVNEARDIDIDETETIFGNTVYRARFPDITMEMTAESDKSHLDRNGRRFRT